MKKNKIRFTKLLEELHARIKSAKGDKELIKKIRETFKTLRPKK